LLNLVLAVCWLIPSAWPIWVHVINVAEPVCPGDSQERIVGSVLSDELHGGLASLFAGCLELHR
jgi:hypothetical protein